MVAFDAASKAQLQMLAANTVTLKSNSQIAGREAEVRQLEELTKGVDDTEPWCTMVIVKLKCLIISRKPLSSRTPQPQHFVSSRFY
jgi:hypothetical protein